MKYQNEYKKINNYFKKSNSILFIPHVDADPDALCGCYALYCYSKSINKKGVIGLQAPLLSKFEFIFNNDLSMIKTYDDFENIKSDIDLIVALDIGVSSRGGKWILDIKNIPIINVDHHIDNDYFGIINIVDDKYSSTCELIYEFIKTNKIFLSKEIAISLYTGMVYDTGSFRYSCTSKQTHQYIGEIVSKYDFDKNTIYELLFENKKVQSLCLQTRVFNSLELYNNGKIAVTTLEKCDYEHCKADESDAIELVRVGSSIEGVDFSIFIHDKIDKIKVSLRSKSDFNVNAVAKKYGGGGHVKASGFSFNGTIKEVKDKLLPDLINEYNNYLQKQFNK